MSVDVQTQTTIDRPVDVVAIAYPGAVSGRVEVTTRPARHS